LGLHESGGASAHDLLRHLAERHLLLVLDNLEHLPDAAPWLAELLEGCPRLAVLATSRAALRLRAERRLPVGPLATPAADGGLTLAEVAASPAVQLFAERAQAAAPEFRLEAENADAVAEICRRLDGIPLALELAAARARVLSSAALLRRLERRLPLLTGGPADLPERQRTLRSTLTWSHDLLAPGEQTLFRRLAVFAGGWTPDAAEAVCADDPSAGSAQATPAHQVFDYLGSLVDKCLVGRAGGVDDEPRFGMLATIREYAEEQLEADDEADLVRARHAEYYGALAERAAPLLRGPAQIAWLGRLDREHDNLLAALEWIVEHGEVDVILRLAAALAPYWEGRGYLSEGRRWLDAALSASRVGPVSREARLRALVAAGELAQWHGALGDAETLQVEGLALARYLGDRRSEAELLGSLSAVYRRQGVLDRALSLSEASLRLSREVGDTPRVAFALLNLGMALQLQGAATRAAPVLKESVHLYRQLADVRWGAIALTLWGWAIFDAGDPDRAAPLLLEGVYALRAVGDQGFIVVGLKTLAGIACARGEPRRAAEWFAAADALRARLGVRLAPRDRAIRQSFLASVRERLTASDLAAASVAGGVLSLDQVLADVGRTWPSALAAGQDQPAAAAPPPDHQEFARNPAPTRLVVPFGTA
jgi:predicted ATPase